MNLHGWIQGAESIPHPQNEATAPKFYKIEPLGYFGPFNIYFLILASLRSACTLHVLSNGQENLDPHNQILDLPLI